MFCKWSEIFFSDSKNSFLVFVVDFLLKIRKLLFGFTKLSQEREEETSNSVLHSSVQHKTIVQK